MRTPMPKGMLPWCLPQWTPHPDAEEILNAVTAAEEEPSLHRQDATLLFLCALSLLALSLLTTRPGDK